MGVSSRPLWVDRDGESWDDDPEQGAEFLGGLLGGAAQALGGGISGIGNLIGGVGGLLNPPLVRPPIPPAQVPVAPGGGVQTATISTPRGNATLQLPEKVVTEQEFRAATQSLNEAINRNTARLNSTQKDIESLSQRVGVVVADTQRDLAKTRDEARAALSRLRREQAQKDTNNLLMSIMMQQQLRRQIEDHTHAVTVGTGTSALTGTTGAADTGDGDNMALFLPLMMGGMGGSGGDNNMMMMAMMFALQR